MTWYQDQKSFFPNNYTFLNRSTKRPVRYIEAEVLSEEDGSDTEMVAGDNDNATDKVTEPSPTKKAKVSKRAVPVEDNESTNTNAKEHKSVKSKTAKNESKEKRKSKKKKKETKGGLLKEKYVHVYRLLFAPTKILYLPDQI